MSGSPLDGNPVVRIMFACQRRRKRERCQGTRERLSTDAEGWFPVRIVIKLPPHGVGAIFTPIEEWLDENCGIAGWSITPAGTSGVLNDAIAVHVNTPTCAVGFVTRWCVSGDPSGFYELRQDEPARRVASQPHKTP